MRANILTDAALTKHAGQFAWLSIDIDKAVNASFLEKFPVDAVPTFLIIDAADERAVLRWLGTPNVGQLEKLMEDGLGASSTGPPAAGISAAQMVLTRADRLNAEGKGKGAIAAYKEAIQQGGPNWVRRDRALESLVSTAQFAHEEEECARVAREEGPSMSRGASFVGVVLTGLWCAMSGPSTANWTSESIRVLKPRTEEALKMANLFSDDRCGLYDALINLAQQQKEQAVATKLALEWLDFLDQEEKNAPDVEARTAADSWRVTAALAAGQPTRALPALQASERDLPNDYNPPARLAVIYNELGQYEKALAESDTAMAKVYGPRRLWVMQTRIKIYENKGDQAAAKRTIEESLQYAETLPSGQVPQPIVAKLKEQLKRYNSK